MPPKNQAATIAAQLASFVAGLRFQHLPKDVIDSAKTLVLDQFACQLIGSTVPWVKPAIDLAKMSRGKGEATLVNHGLRLPVADAVFANATFGQACELDDSAGGSAGHVGSATVPVALALGERNKLTGRQFITGLVAGYELFYRMMLSIRPHHNSRGFHVQGVGGPFGAVGTAGKILGLDSDRMMHAIAIAASYAGGPLEFDQSGGEVKRVHAGIAAQGGLQAAFLASFGLTGPSTIVEGKRGFCAVFSTRSDPSVITKGLGKVFNLPRATFKLFPTNGGTHTSIVALNKLMTEHRFKASDVLRIRAGLPDKVLLHGAGIRYPHDVISAQFSLAYSLALRLVKQDNALEFYRDERLWRDPALTKVMDLVETYADPAAEGDHDHMATITVDLKDGRSLQAVELHRKGSPENPASREDLAAKAHSLSQAVLSKSGVAALVEAIDDLENINTVSELAKLLVRKQVRKR
jgi:2-methylcitrate dehydratase PrpD